MAEAKERARCAGKSWSQYQFYPCSRNGTLEHAGKMWCKQHHPPTVAANQKAKEEKWQQKWAAETKARDDAAAAQAELERKAAAYDRLLAWLEERAKVSRYAATEEIRAVLEGKEKG